MKKRIVAALLTAALSIPLTASAAYHAGDFDGNAALDAFDLALLKRDYLNFDRQFDGDVDGSGTVSVNDLNMMQDYLLGRIDSFSSKLSASSIRLGEELLGAYKFGTIPDDAFCAAQMEFAAELFRKTAQNEENTMISPLSAMLALSMTANGANTQTLAEMESVLGGGMSMAELNGYLSSYIQCRGNELHIADSIWFRDTERLSVSEDFLRTNIDYYDAEIYKAPFNEQTVKDINCWVKKNTDGMIPELVQQLNEQDLMLLINAIAFDANWKDEYEDYQVMDGVFTAADGTEQAAEMMHSNETIYYDFGNAQGFGKDYTGQYRFVAILPEEGMCVSDWVAQMDGSAVLAELHDGEYASVVAQMPKFSYDTSLSLKDPLKELGMSSAFESDADLSGIGESLYGLCVSDVLQKTTITVNETGTRAAAVTMVMVGDACPAPPEEIYYITLDRPFVYMIVDTVYNLPIFMGTVQSLY